MGDFDLRFYFSILLRRLPYVLVSVLLATSIGLVLALKLPKTYRASAKIVVEAPQIPADMARTTVPVDAVEQLQIIAQEITTRDNLLTLAKRYRVYEGKTISDPDIVSNMRKRIRFEQVALDFRSGSGSGATVFNISFDAGNPKLAADVANDMVKLILDRNTRLRIGRAGDTLQFFEQEVGRLGSELSSLDASILEFKNANRDALPDGLEFRRLQRSDLQERLSMLDREEASLRSRRQNLVQIFESTGRLAGSQPPSPEQQLLLELNRALSEQLTIFSEDSSTVVALRARIATLQKSIRENTNKDDVKKPLSELDIQLSDIDARLQQISLEKGAVRKNLVSLSKAIAATPGNETRLNALQRNRDNIQLQYNSTVARLAEASTGEQIEIGAKGGRFSVIEYVTPPEDAISPNKRRIAGMSLAAGIALGLGIVALLELLNKSIRRPSDLAQILPDQQIFVIPYIHASREQSSVREWLAPTKSKSDGGIGSPALSGIGARGR